MAGEPGVVTCCARQAHAAAENIAAGCHTLAQVLRSTSFASGWRESSEHKSNMLSPGATCMGIAAVYAPNSKDKVFWSLILAPPDAKRPS